MSTAESPRTGDDGAGAAPTSAPEHGAGQAVEGPEAEPVDEIVALRRAPIEDPDLALISPYHEDPEAPSGDSLAAESTVSGAADAPLPELLVDDDGLDGALPGASAGDPGAGAPRRTPGPAPASSRAGVPLDLAEPTVAPAVVLSPQTAEPSAPSDPATSGTRPRPGAASDPAVTGEAPAVPAGYPHASRPGTEPGPEPAALAAPTDIDTAARGDADSGEEPLRVAETPDVAVPVAPVRLPPSYPPVHRPEPLPVPARVGEARTEGREPRRWGGTIGVVLVVVLISALLKTFVVQTFTIPSSSMETTLMTGDRVAVSVWDADDVQKGDVVVFKDPDNWLDVKDPTGVRAFVQDALILIHLLPEDSGHHLIKRVIGTAGDHVVSDGKGRITVNGVAVDETYVEKGELPSAVAFDVTVPEGYLWVMGDNRAHSFDSRYHQNDAHHGFVPVEDVVGVARDVIWPVTQWSDVHDGTKVFDDVPAPTGKAPTLPTPAAEDGA
ncbi:signal peptidase I [Actinomyces haliotis]|uniref:signal peptidase I n=1 Tax=Actinomyces haliotis TaxID=1280843 RepID=UPI001E41333F|nr:signal peptidase I [Actinomyces haliotis]